jgi:polyhydroxyalkanoate synthesis regulator phasin
MNDVRILRHSEESRIAERLKAIEGLVDEKTLPPFSIYTGSNPERKYLMDDNLEDTLLLNGERLENYAKKSAILRDYFFRIQESKERFTYNVLTALLGESLRNEKDDTIPRTTKQLIRGELEKIEKAKSPVEVTRSLDFLQVTDKDPWRSDLYRLLAKLEKTNQEVARDFRRIAREQNPVYDTISKTHMQLKNNGYGALKKMVADINANGTMTAESGEVFYGYNYSDLKKDLKTILSLTPEEEKRYIKHHKENPHNIPTSKTFLYKLNPMFRKTFIEEFSKKDGGEEVSIDREKGRRYLELLQTHEKLDQLKVRHTQATELAQAIITGAFHGDRSPRLGELIWGEDAAGNAPSNKKVSLNAAAIRKALIRGMENADISLMTGSMRRSILGKVAEEIAGGEAPAPSIDKGWIKSMFEKVSTDVAGEDPRYRDIAKIVDQRYANKIQKGTPPDAWVEEEFQKILEDALYNEIMRKNGGEELYRELGGKVSKSGTVDIEENVVANRYVPLGVAKTDRKRLAEKALSLHNLNVLFDKVSDRSISKAEAREAIRSGIPILSEHERQLLENNLDRLYENRKLTEEILGIEGTRTRDIDTEVGDYIMEYRGRDFAMRTKNQGVLHRTLSLLGHKSKRLFELESCIEGASSPTISSHSVASGIKDCLQKYASNLERDMDRLNQAAGNPASAMVGMSMFLGMLASLKSLEARGAHLEMSRMELERARKIAFIREGKDKIDQELRRKAVMSETTGSDELLVEKENADEAIFRLAKNSYEYKLESAPGSFKERVGKIRSSQNLEEGAKAVHEGLRETLGKGVLKEHGFNVSESFLSMLDTYAEIRGQKANEDLDGTMTRYLQAFYHEKEGNPLSMLDQYTEKLKGYFEDGSINLYEAKRRLEDLSRKIDEERKSISEKVKEGKRRLEELEGKLAKEETPLDRKRVLRAEASKISSDLVADQAKLKRLAEINAKAEKIALNVDIVMDEATKELANLGQSQRDELAAYAKKHFFKEGRDPIPDEKTLAVLALLSQRYDLGGAFVSEKELKDIRKKTPEGAQGKLPDPEISAIARQLRYRTIGSVNAAAQDIDFFDAMGQRFQGSAWKGTPEERLAFEKGWIDPKTGEINNKSALYSSEELTPEQSEKLRRTAELQQKIFKVSRSVVGISPKFSAMEYSFLAKSLMVESAVNSALHNEGEASRDEALRKLYIKNKESFVKAGDIHVWEVGQEDDKTTQLVIMDQYKTKSVDRKGIKNISRAFGFAFQEDAMEKAKESMDRIAGRSEAPASMEDYEFVRKVTGLDVGSTRFTAQRRSKLNAAATIEAEKQAYRAALRMDQEEKPENEDLSKGMGVKR